MLMYQYKNVMTLEDPHIFKSVFSVFSDLGTLLLHIAEFLGKHCWCCGFEKMAEKKIITPNL